MTPSNPRTPKMTDDKVKACPQEAMPSEEPGPFSKMVEQEWQILLDMARTSDHPDMCLLTRTELAGAMSEAFFAGTDAGRRALQAERDELAERLRYTEEDAVDWRNNAKEAEAERDRLPAELEDADERAHSAEARSGRNLARAEAAEAKLTALVEALKNVRHAITNENGLNAESIACTVWVSEIETAVDRIDNALTAYTAHNSAPVGEARAKRCPRCNSPDPKRHPAMQYGGEVQLCSDPWHAPPTTPTSAPVEDVGEAVREITREHPLAVCIRQAQDDFLKGASSPTDDMATFCARRIAALSPSLIQPQGEERSTDAPENFGPLVDAWNTRSKPPQGDVGADSGLAAADDNHKALVEALMNSAVGLEYMAANRGGKLAREFKDQAAKNRALIAAFQSRQEEK